MTTPTKPNTNAKPEMDMALKSYLKPQTATGKPELPHHTMNCLSQGDASACPVCKPINDKAKFKTGKGYFGSAFDAELPPTPAKAQTSSSPVETPSNRIVISKLHPEIAWINGAETTTAYIVKACNAYPAAEKLAEALRECIHALDPVKYQFTRQDAEQALTDYDKSKGGV